MVEGPEVGRGPVTCQYCWSTEGLVDYVLFESLRVLLRPGNRCPGVVEERYEESRQEIFG